MVDFVTQKQDLPYGIVVYNGVLTDELCGRLIEYFEAQPKDKGAELLYGKPASFEALPLSDDVMLSDPMLKEVYRRMRKRMHGYFDDHIALPEFRDLVKKGCYSLQPRMKRYDAGSEFPLHTDDGSIKAMIRRFAYILYLNDEFKGGDTTFSSGSREVARIRPKKGNMLVAPVHPIYMHQGERIEDGSKYILNGFATVLVSQARAVVLAGKQPSRLAVVSQEIDMLARELRNAAQQIFLDD